MAGTTQDFEGITDVDRRHFDFVETLLRISQALTKEETKDVKLFCMHLIPKGKAEKLKRAVDVFHKLIELRKIDPENLDFVEEMLERMGRHDLIRDVLWPLQPPDREVPENPELQPETSEDGGSADESTMSNTYWIVHGHDRMIQETVNRYKSSLASLCAIRKSKVKFRGYKKRKSILVHFSVPRENTVVLRHMAHHSDPRLVYMGVKSLQIDTEKPIEVTQGTMLHAEEVKRHYSVDDIKVGCSTRSKQQRTPKNWSRLSALNLFSDALPLHLQVAESLEYQGFSYSLAQALVQKYQIREHKMRQVIQNFKNTHVDSKTFMTMRSKLTITENRLKEALDTNEILEKELQQAREFIEKAAKQVTSQVGYMGEKPACGWSLEVETPHAQTHLADQERIACSPRDADDETVNVSAEEGTNGNSGTASFESVGHRKDEISEIQVSELESAVADGMQLRTSGQSKKSMIIFGGPGSEPGKFSNPYGVVVSPSNEIFVVDKGNRRVQAHNIEGVYLRHFPTVIPRSGGKEMVPHDISMDSNGTLWVVGEGKSGQHVVQYSKNGITMATFHLPMIRYFRGIAVDMRSNLIVVTQAGDNHGEVQVFRSDGSLLRKFGHPESEMTYPRYIAVDGEGNILVSDWATDSVYIYDEAGKFMLKFGGRGRGEGQLQFPRGICTDSSGHIIVAATKNSRVQIFTRHGEYVRHVHTGSGIQGVAVGPEGQLVLNDWDDDTVTIFPNY